MLVKRVDDKPEHLKRSIEHIAKGRMRQVVIIIDNADQRPIDIQQNAFIIARDFAQNWNALTFIAVRPQAFFHSRRSGALSAYPHRVFTISPPRPELVIERRLGFALKISQGQVSSEIFKGIKLDIGNMSLFLESLIYSIRTNQEIREILANITGGNIRRVIEFVKKFIGSSNVDSAKILQIMEKTGQYDIPLHEFAKAAIFGDYSHYNAESSLAMNLFDVNYPDEREHFLGTILLSFMLADLSPKDKDGFLTSGNLVDEMQTLGFLGKQTEACLRKLTNKRLIETTERVTFEEDLAGLSGSMPFAFRPTSIGAYHIQRWLGTFAYLDAMVFDTPIFDNRVFENLLPSLEDFAIALRYKRAITFRTYLTAVWHRSGLTPTYFSWGDAVAMGENQFGRVRFAVEKYQ